jgi:tRNA modification GTPase
MDDNVDTIVAIATPPGRGGIGIIRISGKETKNIIPEVLGKKLFPRKAHLCTFKDERNQSIDNGLAIYFPAPASYTGEDMLELHGHGGQAVLSLLVDRVVKLGARLARPGEFTERAFLNEKIDLVQAEAVADLIDSTSKQAARSAVRSLEGEFSKKIQGLLNELIAIRILVEGSLDFSEEDVNFFNPPEIYQRLETCINQTAMVLIQAKQGAMLREGAQAVIIGMPNVGKSSLLNRLAGKEAAIVTATPGTTRDTVAENILIDGIQLRIIDTAGLRNTNDEAELEGIKRAHNAAENTDIILFISEAGRKLEEEEKQLLQQLVKSNYVITIKNKIDLTKENNSIKIVDESQAEISLSAKTGEGINLLLQHLSKHLVETDVREDAFIARERHVIALEKTQALLEKSLRCCDKNKAELLAEELRLAQEKLGNITGIFSTEDLLGEIFSGFCIGK